MGKKKGFGTFQWKNGAIYEGEFDNDMLNGKGLYIFPDGKKYNGDWKNNKMDGTGEFTWPNGRIYIGEYKDGKKKVLGHILILMEEFIKEIGKKGNKKEKECFIYPKKKLGKKVFGIMGKE